ncbi:PrsW family intramembrane metalloprotease [Candidatus Gracilibacteria bacterium]|nr:PrsW family intramembrane metalloprotease [Candidatus Gracilibacteria bacterium]
MKPLISLILGGIAAFIVAQLVAMSGVQTTIDAWVLTLTIVGNDVGERMAMAAQLVLHDGILSNFFVKAYLAGHGLLEEIIKFLVLLVAIRITRPANTREIVISGILIGSGFAVVENFVYFSHGSLYIGFIMLMIRVFGHALFTGIIAALYTLGHFAQMRWIDSGAHKGIVSWMVGHGEKGVEIFWIIFGIVCASAIHAVINAFAAIGMPGPATVVMMIGWSILIHFMFRAESSRPYETYIQEVELLQTITEAERELTEIRDAKPSQARERKLLGHAFRRKTLKKEKQFAKT